MRIRVGFVLGVLSLIGIGCDKGASKCVEGQSSACACPSGGSGAQVCTPSGAFGACTCGSAAAPVAAAVAERCTIDALKCASFSTQGLAGWQLHKRVFDARNGKRFDEAICLAQNSTTATDKVLAGASHFEASYAWQGLGCREKAVGAIEEALRVRPSDKNGWSETCSRCAELKADCALCKTAAAERIACPSMDSLMMDVRDEMLSRAPSDTTWTNPKVEMCIPIALPQPGWYVIGWVQQESPDREFWFHLAVDARTSKVLAVSEAEQRKYNYVCETKFGKVNDRAGAPSTVSMRVDCFDKMGNASGGKLEAEILPPKIVLHPRK